MKANEAHYQLWDRVITLIKQRPVASINMIKQQAVNMMDLAPEEQDFIAHNMHCVLCAVQNINDGVCSYKCPITYVNDNICGNAGSLYNMLRRALRRIGPDWTNDDDGLLDEAIKYAEQIRDVPLPEEYDRELSYYITLSNSREA